MLFTTNDNLSSASPFPPPSGVTAVNVTVRDANGSSITNSSVTIHDGGQSKTVSVSGSNAQRTFLFSLMSELPKAHGISVPFFDNSGVFTCGNGSGTSPSSQLQWEMQWFYLLLAVEISDFGD